MVTIFCGCALIVHIYVFLACFWTCDSAKILVVPDQSLSHVRYFSVISKSLRERGHYVIGIMNADCKYSVKIMEEAGVNVLPVHNRNNYCFTEDQAKFTKNMLKPPGPFTVLEQAAEFSRQFLQDGEALFEDEVLIEQLRTERFDLCLVDGNPLALWDFLIPYKLDVPYVTITTGFLPTFAGVPALPSFSLLQSRTRPVQMSFIERLENTIETILLPIVISRMAGNHDGLVDRFAPEKPKTSIYTLMKKSQLWLVNTHSVIDFPRVSLPHIINTGGLTTSPAKPLPEHLRLLMDESTKGTILLSFGSMVRTVPLEISDKIFQAFQQLTDFTFIMKYNGPPVKSLPKHIHLFEWLPQNDLLGHPSLKLFITHSGNNGQFESLYHGVPMLALPLFGDQFYNAHRMSIKGFGIVMNAYSFSVTELVFNIKELIIKKSYRLAIGKASKTFRNDVLAPREQAVHWIEHVLNHDSLYLRSYATELPWYKYWLLDVILFLLVMIFAIMTTALAVCLFCLKKQKSLKIEEKDPYKIV